MIKSDKKERIIEILKKHQVKRAAFFGSIARDEETAKSDVDILIEFKGRKSLLDLADLKLALEKSLKKKVDILTYKSLHPLLKDRILNEQKMIL